MIRKPLELGLIQNALTIVYTALVFFSPGVVHASGQHLADCDHVLVEPDRSLRHDILKFGDRVAITKIDNSKINAIFLGSVKGRTYFAPTVQRGLKRPIFYIQTNQVQLEQNLVVDGQSVVLPFSLPAEIQFMPTDQLQNCAPQSVIACLMHLRELGLVPKHLSKKLDDDPSALLMQMSSEFSQDALVNDPEGKVIVDAYNNAATRSEKRKLEFKIREHAFNKIIFRLNVLGLAGERTNSISKLVKHLKSGLPAYISVSSGAIGIARPNLSEWDDSIDLPHPDFSGAALPVPKWSPNFEGFHAVYAVGVLPRTKGLDGLWLGHRFVVFDSTEENLNVWNTIQLRVAGTAQFILVAPKN